MIELSCRLKEAHAHAFRQLIDRLDYASIRRCAASEQEWYDMVVCLESFRKALKSKDDAAATART